MACEVAAEAAAAAAAAAPVPPRCTLLSLHATQRARHDWQGMEGFGVEAWVGDNNPNPAQRVHENRLPPPPPQLHPKTHVPRLVAPASAVHSSEVDARDRICDATREMPVTQRARDCRAVDPQSDRWACAAALAAVCCCACATPIFVQLRL